MNIFILKINEKVMKKLFAVLKLRFNDAAKKKEMKSSAQLRVGKLDFKYTHKELSVHIIRCSLRCGFKT